MPGYRSQDRPSAEGRGTEKWFGAAPPALGEFYSPVIPALPGWADVWRSALQASIMSRIWNQNTYLLAVEKEKWCGFLALSPPAGRGSGLGMTQSVDGGRSLAVAVLF
jgi:hypothetical protein